MNITKTSVVGALLGLSLVAACGRDDKSNNTIDAGGGSDSGSGSGGGLTVKDVQADSMKSGTAIELKGVIVTAIDGFGGKTGDFWVQDTDGGARSGVHVFGASSTDVSKLHVGDLVDIKGAQKYEYANNASNLPSTQTLTEVEGTAKGTLVVTKVGTGTVPAPHVLDSVAIAAMSAADRATFLEDWEGVPVTLQNARPTGPGAFGSDEDAKLFTVVNVITVESNLAAFPASSSVNATCYAGITGIVDYVVGKFFTLLPTATTAFTDGGTGCAAPTEYTPATVAEVQAGTKTGYVKLTGVYVMAAATKAGALNKTIWVSDTLAAAAGTGVEIYLPTGVDATTSVLGTKVDVQGLVDEFDITKPAQGDTLTELKDAAVTLSAAATAVPTPLIATVAQVGDITNSESEKYEGVLVTVSGVKVTAVDAMFHVVTLKNKAGETLYMDDDAFTAYSSNGTPADPAVDTCFSALTGVMDVQTTNNQRTINPRSTADMTADNTGAACD